MSNTCVLSDADSLVQTEAERRRRKAGVRQSIENGLGSCMYVYMFVCMGFANTWRFNPRPCTPIFIRWMGRGGRCFPPSRFGTKGRRSQRKKNSGLLSTSTRDWWRVFGPRVIFDPVVRDPRPNFRKIDNFSNLYQHISKTVSRSDLQLSPACSPLHRCSNGKIIGQE